MTDQYLDEAAMMLGYSDWRVAEGRAVSTTVASIRAHATTLAELAKAKDALAEIDAIAVHGRWSNLAGDLVAVAALAAPYRKADPVAEALREALLGANLLTDSELVEHFAEVFAAHGLEIVAGRKS